MYPPSATDSRRTAYTTLFRQCRRCPPPPLLPPTPRPFLSCSGQEPAREREMFYLTTHSTHFIYGYMASVIWLRTILIVSEETRCRHIGYSFRLTTRVILYAPSHRQDNTYHGLCYTSRGALAGTRNSSMGPPHEGSIRRPIAPSANALPLSYVPLPGTGEGRYLCLWQACATTACSECAR